MWGWLYLMWSANITCSALLICFKILSEEFFVRPGSLENNVSIKSAAIGIIVVSRGGSSICRACRHRFSSIGGTDRGILHRTTRTINLSAPVSFAVANSNNVNLTSILGLGFVRRIVTYAGAIRIVYPRASITVRLNNRSTGVAFFNTSLRRGVGKSYTNKAKTFVSRVTDLLGASTGNLGRLTGKCARVCPVTSHYNIFTGASVRPLVGSNTHRRSLTTSVFRTIIGRAVTNLTSNRGVRNGITFLNNPLCFVDRLHREFVRALRLGRRGIIFPRGPRLFITGNTTFCTNRRRPAAVTGLLSSLTRVNSTLRPAGSLSPLFGGRRRLGRFHSHRTGTGISFHPVRACYNGTCLKVSTNSAAAGVILVDRSGGVLCA